MRRLFWIMCAAMALLPASSVLSRAADVPPLVAQPATVLPRAAGTFDYLVVDEKLHRLLIAHTSSRSLDVVNMSTGSLERQVVVGASHGIAVDVKDGKYFVGTSRDSGINDVSRKNLVLNNKMPIDGPIDAATFDPKNGFVYADRADTGQIIIVNGKTDKTAGVISIGGDLEYLDYDPGTDRIYQNIVAPASVAVIDPAKNAVIAKWPTAPASDLSGLAIDSAGKRLFSAGNGKLVMIDLTSGAVVASATIPLEVDQIAFDAAKHRVYCPSPTGEMAVVQETTVGLEGLGSVTVPRHTHSVAVDPATHAVWIVYGTPENDYLMKLIPSP